MLQNPALSAAEKARIREEAKTKGLASAFTLAHTAARGLDNVSTGSTRRLDPTSAARQQAYQDYRAGERNAEAIAAEYQTRKAVQDYRQGERNAEAIAAEYQARKAVQDYRQGERGEYVTPLPVCTAENIEKPKPWWERAKNWISSSSTWWGFSTEDEAIKLMQKTKGFPDIPIILPMLKGFGMDDAAGPLKYTLKTDKTIRLIGRVMDDASPGVLTGIGWGLTVTPNLIKNIRNKSPWNQTTADLLVDTGGFIVSEAAGWGAGLIAAGLVAVASLIAPELAPAAPYVILGAKIAADAWVSVKWDELAETNRWSEQLSQQLENGARFVGEDTMDSMQQAFDTEKYPPVPTPPTPLATGTPAPAGQNPIVQPSGTPAPNTNAPVTPTPMPPPAP